MKAHAGQIDNEVVDSVAKAIASQGWSPFRDIPDVTACMDVPLWDWAWLLLESEVNLNIELPLLADLVGLTAYPSLPTLACDVFSHKDECAVDEPLMQVELSIGGAIRPRWL